MTLIWFQAALWLGLALIATILSIYLRIATALSEIVVGTIAQLIIGALLGASILAGDASWVQFLSGAGAILLTFLAGAELDPGVFRKQWKQALIIGLLSFFLPFFLCAALVPDGIWDGCPKPAGWYRDCHVHDIGRGGVCRDAGAWDQYLRLWENGPCRLLCHRSGNRYCSGANFRPLYAQNRRIYRRHGGGGFSPSLAYPPFLQALWRSAF